uniref:Uncharacterized protein n=1 Tax=Plectus sambesii TaxID=2011161 RepID=A0A914W5L4_9BILA
MWTAARVKRVQETVVAPLFTAAALVDYGNEVTDDRSLPPLLNGDRQQISAACRGRRRRRWPLLSHSQRDCLDRHRAAARVNAAVASAAAQQH